MMCELHTALRTSITPYSTFLKYAGRTLHVSIYNKKRLTIRLAFCLISDFLSSQAVSSQVLSAFTSLTTVFEMGTGGPS